MAFEDRTPKAGLIAAGIVATLLLHGAVAGFVWWQHGHTREEPKDGPSIFFDAQLVKFGKPRDLTFLPHKQGTVKPPDDALKVATSDKALPKIDDKKDKKDTDPLNKTHMDLFKNLKDDDQPAAVDPGEGSLTGSKAGTATVATGDPYILELIDQIGSAWTVPTTIKDSELAKLSAEACLTISDDGTLTGYKILTGSGNGQFDSSLEAALSTIKKLKSPPPDRFKKAASRGKLCPTFSKQ